MRLARLLSDPRPAAELVAFGDSGTHTHGELRVRVSNLAARLRAEGAGPWLLHCEDAYAFAVGLFAVAHAGATAWVSPNRQPGTLRAALAGVSGAILDTIEPGIRAPLVLDPLAAGWAEGDAEELPPLAPDAPLLMLSTSGTTGEGKPIHKTLGHLGREVEVLEATFGPRLGDGTRIFATASAQHLYGMLFRVLWPLAIGRPFAAGTWLHAGELLPRMRAAGDVALASTPAHLRRMPGFEAVRGVCREVWSSGAPLDGDTADAVRVTLGFAPVEIFGSTETGGVAWRRQEPGPERMLWTALPEVRVARATEGPGAGCLAVDSPFVSAAGLSAGEGESFTMADLVEFQDDGRFRVLGRADRIVKIGEKRLSLPEMESRLREHPAVMEAALVTLSARGEARLGAVLVASEAGRALIEREGRRAAARELSEHLAAHWDRVVLPKAWRWLDALPRDAQGKTSVALLRGVFDGPRQPLLLSEERGPDHLARRFEIQSDLAQLDGHFEGFPVVPGVAQLGWVMDALEAHLGGPVGVSSIEALKFREVLRPGQQFELRLSCRRGGGRARFELAEGERVFASGRLRLRDEAGE